MARPNLKAPPLFLLVFASGAAALTYQSLWLRAFGLVFGSSTDATAMVLAIFMGGLALGSALAARRTAARPLLAYARVEFAVAGCALATVPLLRALPRMYASFDALRGLTGAADVLARAGLSALVLLPATMLLGSTLPLAVEAMARRGGDVRRSLGRLYLLNTLGGAVGVVIVPFVLLPGLGMTASFLAAAFVSFLVGAIAWRHDRESGGEDPVSLASPEEPQPAPAAVFALLAALSGAFTFGIEVVWTRSLSLVLGSSVYAFASMLLAVLLGLSAGAWLYERWRASTSGPASSLALLFGSAFVLSLLTLAALGLLPEASLFVQRALPVRFFAHAAAGLALALATLLPVTTLLGIAFPLLLHLAKGGDAQARTGRLYAWNTAGALAGALLTDIVLLGRYGLQGTSFLLSSLLLAGAVAALAAARAGTARLDAVRWAGLGAVLALLIGGAFLLAPRFRPWNAVAMTAGVYEYGLEWKDRPGFSLAELGRERSLLFYEEGREAVVAVVEREGRRFLSVNGKTDAGSGAEDVLTQKFIAHVPLLLHEAPKRVLVVGWGSGASAAAAGLYAVDRITCVEIEPATFRAAPFFENLSGAVRRDPRFEIAFGDGRSYLLRSREAWDVVVSEPSNPWITGVANLFTREFYEIALARLSLGGVFGQWFHYYRFEPEDVKVELRTFAAVFPHVSLWLVPPVPTPEGPRLAADLLLVGSREPLTLDWARLRAAFDGRPGEDLRATRALPDEAALVAAWTLGDSALRRHAGGGGGVENTDDHPVVELVAPRRNVRPRTEIVALAQAQAEAFTAAAGLEEPPLRGLPAAEAARFQEALGERYAASGQPQRARAALERAKHLDPSLDKAVERLANLALDRRDFPAAEAALGELVRLRPKDASAHLRLAAARARQSKWTAAKAALDRALDLDPKAPVDNALREFIERQAEGVASPPPAPR